MISFSSFMLQLLYILCHHRWYKVCFKLSYVFWRNLKGKSYLFIFTIYHALYSFWRIQVFIWYQLPSAWITSFTISYNVSLMVTHPFVLLLFENVFIFPSLLKDILLEKENMVDRFNFAFSILKMLLHFLLASRHPDE